MSLRLPERTLPNPLEFPIRTQVRGVLLSNAHRLPYEGKGYLLIQPERLMIRVLKSRHHLKDTWLESSWEDLRELRNHLRDKRRFDLTLPVEGRELTLRIKVRSDQWKVLDRILDWLPRETRALLCPECGGALLSGDCSECGFRFETWSLRRKRVGQILIFGGYLLTAFMFGTGTFHPALFFPFAIFGPLIGLWYLLHARYRRRLMRSMDLHG